MSRSHGYLTQLWGKAWEFIRSQGMQWETHQPPRATSAAKGERSGPGVKGATYTVSPTPTFQGNSAPLPTSREHLGNQGTLKTQRRIWLLLCIAWSRCCISPVWDKSPHMPKGVFNASQLHCSHPPLLAPPKGHSKISLFQQVFPLHPVKRPFCFVCFFNESILNRSNHTAALQSAKVWAKLAGGFHPSV